MSIKPGQRILGRYLVKELLGEGAMGQVFFGLHEHLELPVAIKVLRGDGTPDILQRFQREARLMARVRHPNAVAVQDYGFLDEGSPCLIMEYIEGDSLSHRLKRSGPLPWPEVVEISRGLLGGLGALHAAGVLHRDLKPSNVVLAPGTPEVPKLIDFGIARPVEAGDQKVTRTGVMVGTPAYMAPEQILCTRLDARTDLYSLGLLMYELLTGDLPYPADDLPAMMRRLKEEISPPVAPAGWPRIPEMVSAAVMAACRPEARERPQSAEAFVALLGGETAPPQGPARPGGATISDDTAQNWNLMDLDAIPEAQAQATTVDHVNRDAIRTRVETTGESSWGRIRAGAVSDGRRYLLAARLPAGQLRNREERRWLTSLTRGHGRGFTMGEHLWFALQGEVEDLRVAQGRSRDLQAQLQERYGEATAIRITLVDKDFAVTGAALVGGASLPDELSDLIKALRE